MLNKTILALGADIKNRFLVAEGRDLYPGPEIGDLSNAENYAFFKSQIRKVAEKLKPNIIAYDLHPGYFSSRLAKEFSYYQFPVQHHHAHIASVMCEHNLKKPVIGVSFDGTGYGADGNMWGGEFLMVNKNGFRRLAHLKYRMMPGGDRVVYEPWRMIISILKEKATGYLNDVKKQDKDLILSMMAKNINSPLSSSAGRLFDAAAALLGICKFPSYEAEGPIKLEAMCDDKIDDRYEFTTVKQNGCHAIDTGELFLGMVRDLRKDKDKPYIATKFHNSVSEIIISMVKKLSKQLGIKNTALSGGVFQNKFLKTKAIKKLSDSGFKVFTNNITPVNDLNISLGQYYVSCYTCKG
ncbi:MAG: carbamoyltransferase HypF [Candidatus Omnitrophota bacterium]|nr:MAG: carbamoyltransferase HypF [Candidatus Omnitrophota bacterium]